MLEPFQYAIVRVVPRVERGEAVNAGVVLFCRPLRFLGVRAQLDTLVAIAEGRAEGGQVATLPQSERFHWLTAPASTIVQSSPVHTGLTDDPAGELDRLFSELVSRPGRRG